MVPGGLNISRGTQEEGGQQLQGRKAIRPQEDSRSSSNGSFVSETKAMNRRTGVMPPVSNHSGGLFERLIARVSDIIAMLYPVQRIFRYSDCLYSVIFIITAKCLSKVMSINVSDDI